MGNNKKWDNSVASSIDRRHFIKLISTFGLATLFGTSSAFAASSQAKGKIVILGGGCAGISMAARLKRMLRNPDITIIDPNDKHYYQPGFTLIASGVYGADDVWKLQEDCMPSDINWVKDSVAGIDPSNKIVYTKKSGNINFDFLVLATGIDYKWDKIEGVEPHSLGVGDAHCMYEYDGAIKTWQGVQKFVKNGGKGVFVDTYTKHKCGGAPKKICLLTEHLSRKKNTRDKLEFNFYTASKQLYDVPFFTPRLLEIYKERNVNLNTRVKVKGIDTSSKKIHMLRTTVAKKEILGADGKPVVTEEKTVTPFTEDYDFVHFLPPMGAHNFVKESGLSWTEGSAAEEGWAMVDKETLVHKKYPNIVCVGDVAGIPTSKTSAATRKQVPVAARNLVCIMEGKEPTEKYNGYAACPIITDYGHILLCEFDYSKKEDISFPFSMLDMSKEQWLAWLLKVYALKPMYFYGMLNGLA